MRDLSILGGNWGYGVTSPLSFAEALAATNFVPEPGMLALLGALPLWGRRLRKKGKVLPYDRASTYTGLLLIDL